MKSSKVKIAQRHYSTGLVLLAAEDQIPGLLEAAFMQFYLAIESVLETQDRAKASQKVQLHHQAISHKIVEHVYLARHRFFGHAHPNNDAYVAAGDDPLTAFDIAKQVLVARWCARALISSELHEKLLSREMLLYPTHGSFICFDGNEVSLNQFELP